MRAFIISALLNARPFHRRLFNGALIVNPRLHHRWGASEAEMFVFKFLPWPGFEPRTSQSNGRERYHSTTAPSLSNALPSPWNALPFSLRITNLSRSLPASFSLLKTVLYSEYSHWER